MGRKYAMLARTGSTPPPGPLPEYREDTDELEVTGRGVTDEVEEEEEPEDEPEDEVAVDLDATAINTDNVGEQSIEINVEGLIAELEAESGHGKSTDDQCARRKLEEYLERKRIARELEDFEDFLVD